MPVATSSLPPSARCSRFLRDASLSQHRGVWTIVANRRLAYPADVSGIEIFRPRASAQCERQVELVAQDLQRHRDPRPAAARKAIEKRPADHAGLRPEGQSFDDIGAA